MPRPSHIGQNKKEVAFVRDLFDHHKDDIEAHTNRPLNINNSQINVQSGELVSAENAPLQNQDYQNKASVIRKQHTFLDDLANHHGDAVDRHMSFGTNVADQSIYAGGKTMKSRKTVKFEANEDGDNDM